MKDKGLFWLFISCLVIAFYFLLAPFFKNYVWLIKSNPVSTVQSISPSPWIPSQNIYENIRPPSLAAVLKASPPKEGAIGRVVVPQVEMDVSIYQMPTQENLLVGAAPFYPEQVLGEGHTILLGHHVQNPTSLFAPLSRVKLQASIYLRTATQLQCYRVVGKKIVSETDLTVLERKANKYLTLITCDTHKATSKRLIIQAELDKEMSYNKKHEGQLERIYNQEVQNLENRRDKLVLKKTIWFFLGGIFLFFLAIGGGVYWKKYEKKRCDHESR
ncbi:class A sortase [Listeria aquatica]|uniref:class A sortase n=1 Tax=Listeria aquatica TaxID=1494960 RepID=UPI003F709161